MFDSKELRRVMGMFATGVTVLTTRDAEGRPYGLTANAVTSLSLSPPLLIICIDKKAETHPHFFDSRCFVVNILAEHQEDLSTHFAKSGGDKFGAVPFSTNQDGVPVLEGTLAQVECRIIATHEGGTRNSPDKRLDRGTSSLRIEVRDKFGDQNDAEHDRAGNILSSYHGNYSSDRDEEFRSDFALAQQIKDGSPCERHQP